MNTAFVREPDDTGQLHCPACGSLGTAVERDALVRFVPCIVLRDGRTVAIPRTFERKANAVWVCERVDALVAEARTASPYRGALPAAGEEKE